MERRGAEPMEMKMQNSLNLARYDSVFANFKAEIGQMGFAGSVLNRALNWKRRSHLRKLEGPNDHGLADIGINRQDIEWARGLSLSHNPMLALDDLSRARIRARRRAQLRQLPGTHAKLTG